MGYISVHLEVGGALGEVIRRLSRASKSDVLLIANQFEEYKEVIDNRGRFYTRAINKADEVLIDVLEEIGDMQIQTGLITLQQRQVGAVNNDRLVMEVKFLDP